MGLVLIITEDRKGENGMTKTGFTKTIGFSPL